MRCAWATICRSVWAEQWRKLLAGSRSGYFILRASGRLARPRVGDLLCSQHDLRSPTGFDLSSTQYGAMFIPRVVLAILASAFGSRPAGRFGLGGQGRSCCFASPPLGIGFGATVMSLNTLVGGFFPRNADGAVLLLNALLAAGTTAGVVVRGHGTDSGRDILHGIRSPLSRGGTRSSRHDRTIQDRSHTGHQSPIPPVRESSRLCHGGGNRTRSEGLPRRTAAHAKAGFAGPYTAWAPCRSE
jgi:hypothetical protein